MLKQPADSDYDNWTPYLENNLSFPFSASSRGVIEGTYLPQVRVLGLEGYNEEYGHIGKIKLKGRRYEETFPLMDLEPFYQKIIETGRF